MTDLSARFALPFLLPGQAQKEVYHNEALAALDGLLHPMVEGPPRQEPPSDPAAGQCWIVAAGASDAWAGESGHLALWTSGGWRFLVPIPGMLAWQRAAGVWLHWDGSAWSDGTLPATRISIAGQQVVDPRAPAIASPSGGTTIDLEARAAVQRSLLH